MKYFVEFQTYKQLMTCLQPIYTVIKLVQVGTFAGMMILSEKVSDGASCASNSGQGVKKVFLKAMEKGYGFTMSEVRDYMSSFDETDDVLIYNRNVKKLLSDHYGDSIQYAPNPRQNESEIVFSSNVNAAQLTAKIKNTNVMKTAGVSLKQALQKVDFGIEDKFCDAEELKPSWEQTSMPVLCTVQHS